LTNSNQEAQLLPREGRSERSGDRPSRGREADPEVVARPTRRRFTAEYKARIVREAEACSGDGDIGALMRREGLYSSLLTTWRREFAKHGERGLAAKRRGPAPKSKPSVREIELERRARKLEKALAKANAIIEFQKKAHEFLGIPLKQHGLDEDDS
jgi:transposase-like protein